MVRDTERYRGRAESESEPEVSGIKFDATEADDTDEPDTTNEHHLDLSGWIIGDKMPYLSDEVAAWTPTRAERTFDAEREAELSGQVDAAEARAQHAEETLRHERSGWHKDKREWQKQEEDLKDLLEQEMEKHRGLSRQYQALERRLVAETKRRKDVEEERSGLEEYLQDIEAREREIGKQRYAQARGISAGLQPQNEAPRQLQDQQHTCMYQA